MRGYYIVFSLVGLLSFFGVFREYQKAGQASKGQAQEQAESSEKLRQTYARSAQEKFERFKEKIESQTRAMKSQREAEMALFEIRNLQAESNARLIGANLALEESAIRYMKTTGELVDDEKKLAAVRKDAADKTTAAATAAEKAKEEDARKKYENSVADSTAIAAEKAKVEDARKKYEDIAAMIKKDDISQAEKRLTELEILLEAELKTDK